MRQINNRYICRGKRKDNGEWVTGYYVFQRKSSGVFGQMISELDSDRHLIIDLRGNSHEVIPETVVRCTGLKDKNGKPIFKGDVLYDKESGFVGTVKFNDIIASFVVVINDTTPTFYHWSWLNKGDVARSKNLKNTEVIGNEFDNPELLEAHK